MFLKKVYSLYSAFCTQPAFYSQSAVCILHSVCILPLVRSLRFTLTGAKTTILPVNKILMRLFAWNSSHLPRQFVSKQLYILFCAFCWEPFANK